MPSLKPHLTRTSAQFSAVTAAFGDAEQPPQEQRELEQHLQIAAGILENGVATSDFHHLIFCLLLYKRLCDVWEEEYEARLAEYQDDSLARAKEAHRFQIPEGCTWTNVRRLSANLGTELNGNFFAIESSNPCLRGVFLNVDFADEQRFPDQLLKLLMAHLDSRRLRRADVHSSVLGDACQRLIDRFADAGDLRHRDRRTPAGVARLLVSLSQPDEGMTVYDPACCSAGLLLETARYLERAGKESTTLTLFGQESNRFAWAICKMLLVLYEVENVSIECGDTLRDPRFLEPAPSAIVSERMLRRFDRVLANPPFSLSPWGHNDWSKGDPFRRDCYGCPPRAYGDLAFVLHMLGSLQDGGRMVVVVPYGVLSRGGIEGRIRENLLSSDLLEAVVGLGEKLFVGTTVPVAALIFQRDKKRERQNRVLIVNGEGEQTCGRRLNVLSDVNVARLVEATQRFDSEPGFCRVVTLNELKQHDFDLNIVRYVQTDSSPEADGRPAQQQSLMAELGAIAAASKSHQEASDIDPTLAKLDETIVTVQAALDHARKVRKLRARELLMPVSNSSTFDYFELGKVPSRWRYVALEEVLAASLLNGVYKTKSALGEGVLFLGQKSLSTDGVVTLEQARRIRLSDAECARFEIQRGDVLMRRVHATKDGCGRSALVTHLPAPVVFESSIVRLRANPARVDPLIFIHWLHHPVARQYLESRTFGTVQMSINHGALRQLLCPIISDQRERQAIAGELLILSKMVESRGRELSQLIRMRDILSNHASRSAIRRTASAVRKGPPKAGSE
jgi:type I restriction enzyme M protein